MSLADQITEGRISVRIRTAEHRVVGVAIDSTRAVTASRVLEGRPVEAAVAALPRLFALCGVAQTVAGLAAAETALALAPEAAVQDLRGRLVVSEALEQTLWLLLVTLPGLLRAPPDLSVLAAARRGLAGLRAGLCGAEGWTRLGGAEPAVDPSPACTAWREPADAVTRSLFGPSVDPDRLVADVEVFSAWVAASETPTARLCRSLSEPDRAGFGRSDVPVLPDTLATGWFDQRLARDADGCFRSQPETEAGPAETGSWARHRTQPLCAALARAYGNGLLARLAARLVDVVGCCQRLSDPGLGPAPARTCTGTPGSGTAVLDTARGLLAHHVDIADGIVQVYRVLAPTEWTFHPQGPVAQGLLGRSAEDRNRLKHQATLLAALADPCVAFRLDLD